MMIELSVNKFRANIRKYVDNAIHDHIPLRISRRSGKDFVVLGAEDWEREQETLYVLQNNTLMKQISSSLNTHIKGNGYNPSKAELDEINSF